MEPLSFRRAEQDAEIARCAEIMCETDPWVTFGRTVPQAVAILSNPDLEITLAEKNGEMVGYISVNMRVGPFRGYIQVLCVRPEFRGQGVGAALLAFAEERIFQESPNSFLLVSSFNFRARRLYERLGYRPIGELPDFVVEGHSEYIMRKTIGPLIGWNSKGQR